MPDSSNTLRVLAIHAHPDDIEFQCAGTLALLKQAGCDISIVTMTAGDCGSAELGPDKIAAIRRNEAEQSATLLHADYECLEFRDVMIVFDNPSRQRVAGLLRRKRPDIVITAPPVDYMPDHEITSRLVRDACFNAPIPNYVSSTDSNATQPLAKIPYLYYVDPIEGVDYFGNPVEPDFIIDITATYELKKKMLACHESQRAWLLRQHGIDEYLNSCDRWSQARGAQIGVSYGEAFRQHVGHPYPSDNRLLQLVKQ